MGDNSTNVIPFNFGKQQVRTLLINDQPWFVAADVCASLAIANVSLAVNGRADRESDGLDQDEKGIATVNTPSGAQEMLVVNESGLYSLIFKSRKGEAKRFKKWVTAEVLPAIRKHGRYEDHQAKMPTLMDELIGMSELSVIKGLIRDKGKAVSADRQKSFALTMHNRLHTRFNVPRTELIPAGQFEAACNFIAAYVLEGEFLPRHEHVQIVGGPLKRYLVAFNHKGEQTIEEIPDNAYVLSQQELMAGMVASPGDIPVSTPDMFQFAMAALINLQARSQAQSRRAAA